MAAPPAFKIDVDAFWRDPYPVYQEMHAEAPIAFCPQLGAVLMTRHADAEPPVSAMDRFIRPSSSGNTRIPAIFEAITSASRSVSPSAMPSSTTNP